MDDPLKRPILRAVFTLPDGTVLRRDWTIQDATPDILKEPPEWLVERARRWDHPQDPITLSGRVMPGHEDDARQVLA
jgi:hypothetical protein